MQVHANWRCPARLALILAIFTLGAVLVAQAGQFNMTYERVVTDTNGNTIATYKQAITDWQDLPYGSPWRTYFTQLVGTKTVLDYMRTVAGQLNQDLNLNISDRNLVSTSGKSSEGYVINLYKGVTQYSQGSSQRFVALHELGHVAMLNAYPGSFDFSGLDYGPNNIHYMDDILPNHKTSWCEGWANFFAAYKNDGKVFNLSLSDPTIVNFLKDNTFDEANRNELYVGKTLLDIANTIPNGKDKIYAALAGTAPHTSAKEFLRGYLKLYPSDQVAVARIVDANSHGKASTGELLDYLNGGSRTVSSAFYAFLTERNGGQTPNLTGTSTQTASSGGWWTRVKDWFARLFGKGSSYTTAASGAIANQPTSTTSTTPTYTTLPPQFNRTTGAEGVSRTEVPVAQSVAPQEMVGKDKGLALQPGNELVRLHEAYVQAFGRYNQLLSGRDTNDPQVKQAREDLQRAKAELEAARTQLK